MDQEQKKLFKAMTPGKKMEYMWMYYKTWFAGLLILCTGIKPSFLTVFAPALAVKLVADLCRKVPFRQVFLLGSTVLPACGVVLWQSAVLFGQETGNGMTFAPWYVFSLHANKTKLAVLCSVAFPLVILLFSIKEIFSSNSSRLAKIIATS